MPRMPPVMASINPTDHLSRPCILRAETTACSGLVWLDIGRVVQLVEGHT